MLLEGEAYWSVVLFWVAWSDGGVGRMVMVKVWGLPRHGHVLYVGDCWGTQGRREIIVCCFKEEGLVKGYMIEVMLSGSLC